jgi:hypothetical protein
MVMEHVWLVSTWHIVDVCLEVLSGGKVNETVPVVEQLPEPQCALDADAVSNQVTEIGVDESSLDPRRWSFAVSDGLSIYVQSLGA